MGADDQSMFDKVKDAAAGMKEKVGGMVGKHEDKIDSAIDKTGDFVDDKTGGKYAEKVDKAQQAASDAVDKITPEDEASAEPPADASS